jgi:uroporphyrinogen-III synthase
MSGDALRREPPLPLAGRHIVVTRPAGQAEPLVSAIENAGGIAVRFPVLAIADIEDRRPLNDIATRLDQYDLAVFVSPNAVYKALSVLTAQRPWPARLRVATVGKSSKSELKRFGIADVIAPAGRFDSEALLELPELQALSGKRVVIFRGDGGRELLGDTLKERGASVDYVTCYRRSLPQADAAPLLKLWEGRQLDAFVVTSSEGLRNLLKLLGDAGARRLKQTPLFVPHARIAEEARKLGLQCVLLTAPGDAGVLAGLTEYFV